MKRYQHKLPAKIVLIILLYCMQAYPDKWTNFTNTTYCKDIVLEGNLAWIATEGGVVAFNTATNSGVSYTTANGLVNNYVSAIAIDNQGNKWFGTAGGVSKFDGATWTSYTKANGLANNFITSVAIDKQGNKWFGTGFGGGVTKYDGIAWTTYTTASGLISNYVNTIAIDSQDVKWFGTWSGVSKLDGAVWSNYTTGNGLVSNSVKTIAVDTKGRKWIGTVNGISKFNDTTWTSYTTSSGKNLANNFINDIYIDDNGYKWFATGGESNKIACGVSKFNDTSFTNYETTNHDIATSVQVDLSGSIWIGKVNGLENIFNAISTDYDIKTSGLLHNCVNALAIEGQNNKWFGTGLGMGSEGGISKYDGNSWSSFLSTPTGTFAIAIDNIGVKWFAKKDSSGCCVSSLNGTIWSKYTMANGLPSNYTEIQAIAVDGQNNKWFATGGEGVWKFDGDTWTTYTKTNGLANNIVNAVQIDDANNKWFGTDSGVSKFDGTTWTTYTNSDDLVNNHVNCIAFDNQGNKWFGTDSGVSKFTGTDWTSYGVASGLVNRFVNSIAIDSLDNKWFGTDSGISRFDNSIWASLSTVDGLVANHVNAIIIDGLDNKWIATGDPYGYGGGVSMYGPDNETIISNGQVFTAEDAQLNLFPNPFKSSILFRYSIPHKARIRLVIYDITGKGIKVLFDGLRSNGNVSWDGKQQDGKPVGTGIYFARMDYLGKCTSRTILYAK